MKSRVPQESVLGRTLFIIFINDINVAVSSHVLKFTDDTKICREIASTEDAVILIMIYMRISSQLTGR